MSSGSTSEDTRASRSTDCDFSDDTTRTGIRSCQVYFRGGPAARINTIHVGQLHDSTSNAHIHSPAAREVYIELPAEVAVLGDVGPLKKFIDGARDGSSSVGEVPQRRVQEREIQFVCHQQTRDLSVWIHVDDMLLSGVKEKVDLVEKQFGDHMLLKKNIFGKRRPDKDT